MTRTPPPDSVLRKVRRLLEEFTGATAILGATDLARRTGLAKTTVTRLMAELDEVGLVRRRGTRYELGPFFFELGQRVPWTRDLRVLAMPHLRRLAALSGETALIAFPGTHETLFLEQYVGQHSDGIALQVIEGRAPFHAGASGKVLLAFGEPEFVARVLAAPLTRRTPKTIVHPIPLQAELESIRRVGYAIERQELMLGHAAVAAPVLRGGRAVAALTLMGPVTSFDPAAFTATVRDAARELAESFSHVSSL